MKYTKLVITCLVAFILTGLLVPKETCEPVSVTSSRAGNIRVKAVRPPEGWRAWASHSPNSPHKYRRINTIPFLETLGQ